MCERVVTLLKELSQNYSRTVKVICCDNAGENVTLAKTCKREGMDIDFESTAPGIPQHTGVVKRDVRQSQVS